MNKRRLPLFAALMTVVAVAMTVGATTAFATHVDPVFVPGLNAQPSDCPEGSIGFKAQQAGGDVTSGTYTDGTFSVDITVHQTADGPTFDFDANKGVVTVFVKGGSLGSNRYDYDPAETEDTGLHSPVNASGNWAGLSHIVFCYLPKALPDIATDASGAGSTGDELSDTAHLTGGDNPTGTITFTLYGPDDEDCETVIYTEVVDVDGNGDYSTDGDGLPVDGNIALTAGTYQWIAYYGGDDNNEDAGPTACDDPREASVITAAAPTLTTEIHLDPESDPPTVVLAVDLGSSVHDAATADGPDALGDPTGDVDFTFYKGECEDDSNLLFTDLDVPLVDGVADPSDSSGALGAGEYHFQAHYDSDNEAVWSDSDSLCEPLTVNKGDLDIVTYIHNDAHGVITEVPVGGTVHDTATFSGAVAGFAPDPDAVGFVFYNTIDCTGDGILKSNIGADSVSGDPRSENVGPLASGAYSFRARFAGDDNYNAVPGSDVACEPLSVRTFGKTMGFWGNRNGQALIPAGFTYVLGTKPGGCYIDVTKANSTTILPNTKNGLSLMTMCDAVSERDTGLGNSSVGAINNLLAQTLALKLNIQFIAGFAGQTIGAMGCTPVGTLSSTSTVEDVLAYANALIGNMKSGAPVVTQQQIGDLNGLLGQCINIEA